MRQYLDALQHTLDFGERTPNRTGIDTISYPGHMMRFDLRQGFPAVTTKKLHFKSVVKELLWFLRGEINISTLGCGIWDGWAIKPEAEYDGFATGDVPHCYGEMWRRFPGQLGYTDQIQGLIDRIENDPNSRRLIISSWSPEYQDLAGLAWCHCFYQFKITGEYIDLMMTQRSADMALGVPFNVASASLLLSMVAARTGYTPRYFVHYINDMHIYVNHLDGIKEQLKRDPKNLPKLILRADHKTELWDYKVSDIDLQDYSHHPKLEFEVAV